jgi:hypothetical protein
VRGVRRRRTPSLSRVWLGLVAGMTVGSILLLGLSAAVQIAVTATIKDTADPASSGGTGVCQESSVVGEQCAVGNTATGTRLVKGIPTNYGGRFGFAAFGVQIAFRFSPGMLSFQVLFERFGLALAAPSTGISS